MKDNYLFLKEENLNSLYNIAHETENLYKKEMYNQIPQECRKALEVIIEDFCRYYNVEKDPSETLYEITKKIQLIHRNPEFWDDFFEIRKKGNANAHAKDYTKISKNQAENHLKVFYRLITDYYEFKNKKKIDSNYQIPEQEKIVEERLKSHVEKTIQKVIQNKNHESDKKYQQIENNQKEIKEILNSQKKEIKEELLTSIKALFDQYNKTTQSKKEELQNNNNIKIIEEYLKQAESNYNNRKYKEFLDNWNNILVLSPNYSTDYAKLAYAENELGEHDKAIEDYTKAIALDNEDIICYNNRAEAYFANKNYKEAVNDWHKYMMEENNQESIDIWVDYFKLAYAEYKIEEYDNALNHYSVYLKNNPNDSNAYNNRGIIWKNKEEYDKAIEDYTKAIALDNEDIMYYNNRAEAYFANKNYKEAVNDYNKVLELDPEYEIDYFKLADAEDEIEEYDNALVHYSIYIKDNPNNSDAYNNRGCVYEQLEEYHAAKTDYKMALDIDKENKYAQKNLSRILNNNF